MIMHGAWNASSLVSVVNSLRMLHTIIAKEDSSRGDQLVAAVNVAADDAVGASLSGWNDNKVYPMDVESQKLFALQYPNTQDSFQEMGSQP
jgi:hypothetical protein